MKDSATPPVPNLEFVTRRLRVPAIRHDNGHYDGPENGSENGHDDAIVQKATYRRRIEGARKEESLPVVDILGPESHELFVCLDPLSHVVESQRFAELHEHVNKGGRFP